MISSLKRTRRYIALSVAVVLIALFALPSADAQPGYPPGRGDFPGCLKMCSRKLNECLRTTPNTNDGCNIDYGNCNDYCNTGRRN